MELLLAQSIIALDWRILPIIGGALFVTGGWVNSLRNAPTKDGVNKTVKEATKSLVPIAVCDERLKKIESDFAHVIEGQARQEKMLAEIRSNMPEKRK